MIEGVIIKKLAKNSDVRGWLIETFRRDEIEYAPAMEYVSQTMPGVVRGPHEHQWQSDYFVFLAGKFKIYLWDNRLGAKNYRQRQVIEAGEDAPSAILVPPGVVHAYQCVSAGPGLVINMPDKLFKGENKAEAVDEIRWESAADSPFKID